MRPREFLDVARPLSTSSTESSRRAAIIHAYYSLMLESRDSLARWNRPMPPRQNVHAWVRHTFGYSTSADLKLLGLMLDSMCQWRNRASYQMQSVPEFTTNQMAGDSVRDAARGIALLDAIETDPARRSTAISALPP